MRGTGTLSPSQTPLFGPPSYLYLNRLPLVLFDLSSLSSVIYAPPPLFRLRRLLHLFLFPLRTETSTTPSTTTSSTSVKSSLEYYSSTSVMLSCCLAAAYRGVSVPPVVSLKGVWTQSASVRHCPTGSLFTGSFRNWMRKRSPSKCCKLLSYSQELPAGNLLFWAHFR